MSWEEIKRLAADLQRLQLGESTYRLEFFKNILFFLFNFKMTISRLSDRNCIQLVNKLSEINFINVFHTLDGKEYVTEEQLINEIYNELCANNGI